MPCRKCKEEGKRCFDQMVPTMGLSKTQSELLGDLRGQSREEWVHLGRRCPNLPPIFFQVIILNKYVWMLVPEIWVSCRELLAINIIGRLVSWTSPFWNFFCFVSLTLFSTKRETSLAYWHMVPSIYNKINNSFTPWLNPPLLRCHNRFSQSAKGKTYKW